MGAVEGRLIAREDLRDVGATRELADRFAATPVAPGATISSEQQYLASWRFRSRRSASRRSSASSSHR
jgi:hypothetical protein